MKWWISDTHFGHANIIGYSNRPFKDVIDMNDHMIINWNAHIDPQDEVFIVGDMMLGHPDYWESTLNKLNGKLHLIQGNHDKQFVKKDYVKNRMVWIKDYYELHVQDSEANDGKSQLIVMSHYPLLSWNRARHGAWMLHGHSHGSLNHLNEGIKRLDVGVDSHHFHPWSYDELKEYFKDKNISD